MAEQNTEQNTEQKTQQNTQKRFKRPKAICFDLHGTAIKWSFSHKVLIPYLKQYAKYYAETNFESSECQNLIERLRRGHDTTGGPTIPPKTATKEEICAGIDAYVNHCTDNFLESEGIILYRFAVWFDGFTEKRIVTPMYGDVGTRFNKWRFNLKAKIYVVSNGWSAATKKFLQFTSQGDLSHFIEGYYDSSQLGELTRSSAFRKLSTEIGIAPEDCIFLTKNPDAARAAQKAGMDGVLVVSHRKNLEQLEGENFQSLPIIWSFNELQFEKA